MRSRWSEALQATIDDGNKILKIRSPSKVTYDTGKNAVQGLANAFKDGQAVLRKSAQDMVKVITGSMQSVAKGIGDDFKGAWSSASSAWSASNAWFTSNVTAPLKTNFSNALKDVQKSFTDTFTVIKSVWTSVPSWFTTNITTPLQTAFKAAVENIKGYFSSLWSAIKSGVSAPLNSVIGSIERVARESAKALNLLISGANAVSTGSALPRLSETLTLTRIPAYAMGGIVDTGQMFIAREAGPELVGSFNGNTGVMNNNQIVDAVSTGVANAVSAVFRDGNNSDKPININLTVKLDGREIESNIKRVQFERGVDIFNGGYNFGLT